MVRCAYTSYRLYIYTMPCMCIPLTFTISEYLVLYTYSLVHVCG